MIIPLVNGHVHLISQIGQNVAVVEERGLVHHGDTVALDEGIGLALNEQESEERTVTWRQMQGSPTVLADSLLIYPILDYILHLLGHLFFGPRLLRLVLTRILHLTGDQRVAVHVVLVAKDEKRALLEVANEVFEDVVLTADGTLMHERLSAIVEDENELMHLNVVQATEDIHESVHVVRLDGREQHLLLDLELGILLLHLL